MYASVLALSHTATASDEVDQCSEERNNNEEQNPHCLGETTDGVVAEEVGDDREEDHDVSDDQKRDDESPDEISQSHDVKPFEVAGYTELRMGNFPQALILSD